MLSISCVPANHFSIHATNLVGQLVSKNVISFVDIHKCMNVSVCKVCLEKSITQEYIVIQKLRSKEDQFLSPMRSGRAILYKQMYHVLPAHALKYQVSTKDYLV